MTSANITVPKPVNEPVKSYEPGSAERASLKEELKKLQTTEIEISSKNMRS